MGFKNSKSTKGTLKLRTENLDVKVIKDYRFNGKTGKFQLGESVLEDKTELKMLAIVNTQLVPNANLFLYDKKDRNKERATQKVLYFVAETGHFASMILRGASLANFDKLGDLIELDNFEHGTMSDITDFGLSVTIKKYASDKGYCMEFELVEPAKDVIETLSAWDYDFANLTDLRIALEYINPENKNDKTVFEDVFALPLSNEYVQLMLNK